MQSLTWSNECLQMRAGWSRRLSALTGNGTQNLINGGQQHHLTLHRHLSGAHPLDTADIWGWWGLNLKYEWTVKGNQTYEEKRQHEINVIILAITWLRFTECLPCARCFHHFIQFKSFNLYNSVSQRGDKGLKGLLTLLKIYQYERNLGEKEKTEMPWLSLLLPLLQNIFIFLNYCLIHVHCQLVF